LLGAAKSISKVRNGDIDVAEFDLRNSRFDRKWGHGSRDSPALGDCLAEINVEANHLARLRIRCSEGRHVGKRPAAQLLALRNVRELVGVRCRYDRTQTRGGDYQSD